VIIPVRISGPEDGLRESALIVDWPTTATTPEGPRIAAAVTKKIIKKSTQRPPIAKRPTASGGFLYQNRALVVLESDDPLFDRNGFRIIDHNQSRAQNADAIRMKTHELVFRFVAVHPDLFNRFLKKNPFGTDDL
jgi:hypothetical protein